MTKDLETGLDAVANMQGNVDHENIKFEMMDVLKDARYFLNSPDEFHRETGKDQQIVIAQLDDYIEKAERILQ